VTRDEAKALAEELARECSARLPIADPMGSPTERLIREAILRALDRATTPSRLQAAERAVVEAALAADDAAWKLSHDDTPGSARKFGASVAARGEAMSRLRALREQAKAEECGAFMSRLRALREQAKAEECGAFVEAKTRNTAPSDETFAKHNLRCDLPRGHEGKHCGDLGRWEWEWE
jgi:hypothetical protein